MPDGELVCVRVAVRVVVGEEDGELPGEIVAVGEGVCEGVCDGGGTQLTSVTDPGVPSAPSAVLRPVALPVVDEVTIAVFTYDEPPPPPA